MHTQWLARYVQAAVVGAALLCGFSFSLHAAETSKAPDAYAKQATWAQTMVAARAQYLNWRAEAQGNVAVTAGPWYATRPLPCKTFDTALFPEKGIDLQAKENKKGKGLWSRHAEWCDGVVQNLPPRDQAATYLYRTLRADKAIKVAAGFGSDDGLVVWLNGKQLIHKDVARGAAPDSDVAELDLVAGENTLLLKIFNRGGDHAFYFGLKDPARSLWKHIKEDFPEEASAMESDLSEGGCINWFGQGSAMSLGASLVGRVAGALGGAGQDLKKELDDLRKAKTAADDARWLNLYAKAIALRAEFAAVNSIDLPALRRAIEDLNKTYPQQYARGPEFLDRLSKLEAKMVPVKDKLAQGDAQAASVLEQIAPEAIALRHDALLANPLLNFDKLLLVKRDPRSMGLPQNWQGNCALPRTGYDNEIDVLSPVSPEGKLTTLYKPQAGRFVGNLALHFDGDRLMFSMPGDNTRWQIFEIKANGSGLRQVSPGEEPDVDNYDPCYLPNGKIIYASTMSFQGVPCVGGSNTVANFCLLDPATKNIRQLCFDQEHDWCPTVMNDGRVMYTRWEYTDTPHYFTRLLFQMHPDGTNQSALYGSNSYWPNSLFYTRAIPNQPTKVVGIISGHHGVTRMGELIVFDTSLGQFESDGVVQRIPGYGKKVEPVIKDQLVAESWPKFLHPYPLSDKYFIVSMKPTAQSAWGIYLVDVFDNMLLLAQTPGYALMEPVALRKTPTPPVIPDHVNLASSTGTIYLTDVYAGEGMRGVPRGTVKKLRIFEPHYAYPHMGGHISIGIDGPWDVHRILGTVPVEADGSASFTAPANTPIAVQPLDSQGRAVQIMRSWMTAMPGETLSCVGCHEKQRDVPSAKKTMAFSRDASPITPWYGPARGFSFRREVQPVLDKYCVGCHNGQTRPGTIATMPDFTDKATNAAGNFTPSYVALHPFVRRPGPESDYHVQVPYEYHASTSELVQMLKKGHYNVKLDAEAWDRLYTWIDLNVPDHGTWTEHRPIAANYHERRLEMRTKYGNNPEDPEAMPDLPRLPIAYVPPAPLPPRQSQNLQCPGWPFDAAEAKRRQAAASLPSQPSVDLGNGLAIKLALIPKGQFIMGDANGCLDEQPQAAVKIDKSFYLGVTEVTNEQFAAFDPTHDSRVISVTNKDQTSPGEPVNRPKQPVVRVSWQQAMAYCNWLSQRTGKHFTLPTEAQWEYACRAGTDSPMSFGDAGTNFGKFANLADMRIEGLCRANSPKWIPAIMTVDDGSVVTAEVGKYAANAWGLYDMHGNAAEWTRTTFAPYPYLDDDGRNAVSAPNDASDKVVRGGSWHDRPARATSSFRLAYPPYQKIFDVGFRVMCEAE